MDSVDGYQAPYARNDNSSRFFPGLSAGMPGVEGSCRRLKICIVTPDMKGPLFGGGIGTAYHYLAMSLKKRGHAVTILYTLGNRTLAGSIRSWQDDFANKGITFVALPDNLVPLSKGRLGGYLRVQVEVYEWLKHHTFDLVHTPEWRAHAYFCLVAKRLGIAFGKTLFCVGTHSPTLWNILGNNRLVTEEAQLVDAYMERQCVELADIVLSPSQYMLNWMTSHAFALPEGRCFVQPNLIPKPSNPGGLLDSDRSCRQAIESIVFFGRFDARKGFYIFCKALELIENRLLRHIKIIFLGRHSLNFNSGGYIKDRSKNWRFTYRVIDDLNSEQAIDLLTHEKCLVVMPSLIDNSPYTVMECIVNRIPFIASHVGGIAELIHPEDIHQATFSPHPKKLALKIEEVLKKDAFCPKLSFDFSENEKIWQNWHEILDSAYGNVPHVHQTASPAYGTSAPHSTPLVSVCMPHYNRGQLLLQAIDSLKQQDYSKFEVIVVDDGSDQPESMDVLDSMQGDFQQRGWKLFRQHNQYPGAARNHAARHSKGEYLLFMDDDNVAMPDEISKLVAIAQFSKADALTSFRMRFTGENVPGAGNLDCLIPAVGAAAAVGVLFNCYGDTNCFIRRDVFEAIGGFSEDYGVGREDEEFLANIVTSGFKLMVIPEALYYYREAVQKIRAGHLDNLGYEPQFAGELRALRPYYKSISPELIDLLFLIRSLNLQNNISVVTLLLKRLMTYSCIQKASGFLPRTLKQYLNARLGAILGR